MNFKEALFVPHPVYLNQPFKKFNTDLFGESQSIELYAFQIQSTNNALRSTRIDGHSHACLTMLILKQYAPSETYPKGSCRGGKDEVVHASLIFKAFYFLLDHWKQAENSTKFQNF